MPERRIQPRFDVCLDVRWQASAAHYNVRIADISEGGCYVDSILEVTTGEALVLKILTAERGWLEVHGVVAHHFPRLGFGVSFVNLSDEQSRRIRGLIEQFSLKRGSPSPGAHGITKRSITVATRLCKHP